VLVPYADQRKLDSTTMIEAAKASGSSVDDFPCIETVDTFQGEDAHVVIPNLAITDGDALRFMIQEGCMNVSSTQAWKSSSWSGLKRYSARITSKTGR